MFAVFASALEVPALPLVAGVELAAAPSPHQVRWLNPVVTPLKCTFIPSITIPTGSFLSERQELKITKSVKVCGIEVNSIEAASAPRVLVSISSIRRLLRKG